MCFCSGEVDESSILARVIPYLTTLARRSLNVSQFTKTDNFCPSLATMLTDGGYAREDVTLSTDVRSGGYRADVSSVEKNKAASFRHLSE